jgi:hypothetical protein
MVPVARAAKLALRSKTALFLTERLTPNVEDWLGHPPQETYRHQGATEHRQKSAFWERMGRAGFSWRR